MLKRITRSILPGDRNEEPSPLDSALAPGTGGIPGLGLHFGSLIPSVTPDTIVGDTYTGILREAGAIVDERATIASSKNHWRELLDYDGAQTDGEGIYGPVEGILSANLSQDEYCRRARRLCRHLDASSNHAGRVAEVLQSCLGYATVARKLRAVRLWAILLRYCSSEALVAKTSSTPFLRPVQKICLDTNGHPGLRARMYQVVAGAVLVYPGCKAFKVLWHAVKSPVDPAEGIAFSNPLFVLPNVADGGPTKAIGVPESSDASPVADVGSTNLHSSPNKLVRLPSTAKVPAFAEMGDPRRFSVATVSTVLSAAGTLPPYTEATEDSSIDRLAPPEYER